MGHSGSALFPAAAFSSVTGGAAGIRLYLTSNPGPGAGIHYGRS